MTDMTRYSAWATTVEGYGDHDLSIAETDGQGTVQALDTVADLGGIDPDSPTLMTELDDRLAVHGYTRVGDWDTADWGYVAWVERV